MANRTAKLYVRSKLGYHKPSKRLADLPDGENYQLFWYDGTRKKARAVGRFADEAQTALVNKEAELRRAAITGTVPEAVVPENRTTTGRDFHLAVQQYLSEVKSGKSRKTHLAYSITLQVFSKNCKVCTLEELTRQDVSAYTGTLRDGNLAPRTIANRLNFLKTFFRHFEVTWPLMKSDRVKFTEKQVVAYSVEVLQRLFQEADREEYELFQFLLCTGVREQEAMFAAWKDVDFNGKSFKVSEKLDLGFVPKDKEESVIPIPDSLAALLKSRRERHPDARLIFPLHDGKPNGHMLRTLQRLAHRAGLNCGGCYNRAGHCCKNRPMCKGWGLHRFPIL
jgi:integrase